MSSRHSKGLRPLSFFVLSLTLVSAAVAQIAPLNRVPARSSADVTEFSDFIGTAPVPARTGPLPDTAFRPLSQGGPWGQLPRVDLTPDAAQALQDATAGRWAEVKALLARGTVAPDARDEQGRSLLSLAAAQGQVAAVRDVLASGAGVDLPGTMGLTPLGAAAWRGHELVVRELLMVGADPNRPGAARQTPLHLAAQTGQVRVMAMLLRAGADTSAMNREGLTPLGEAARMGRTDAMARLLEAGVPVAQPDRHGLNALHAAAVNDQAAAVQWLSARGVPVQGPITQLLVDTLGQRQPALR
jgi:ankyrin repeat protein